MAVVPPASMPLPHNSFKYPTAFFLLNNLLLSELFLLDGIWMHACTRHRVVEGFASDILGILQRPWKIVSLSYLNESLSSVYPWEKSTDCCFVFSASSYHQAIPQLKISSGFLLPAALSLSSFDKISRPFIISLFPTRSICLVWINILTSPSNVHMSRCSNCPFKAQHKFNSFLETSPYH